MPCTGEFHRRCATHHDLTRSSPPDLWPCGLLNHARQTRQTEDLKKKLHSCFVPILSHVDVDVVVVVVVAEFDGEFHPEKFRRAVNAGPVPGFS